MATDSTPPTDAATPQVPVSRFAAPEIVDDRDRMQAELDALRAEAATEVSNEGSRDPRELAAFRDRAIDRAVDRADKDRLHDRIDNDFSYHAPTGGQPELYEFIRAHARHLAHTIVDSTPAGREQSTALTKLEEVVFFANAAIARHG